MRREGSIVGTLVFMLFGPIVWALHLLVAYGTHASLCATAASEPVANAALHLVLGGATIAAAIGLTIAAVRPPLVRWMLRAVPATSAEAGFATNVMQILVLLSLLGVTFAGLAMMLLPLCSQLR